MKDFVSRRTPSDALPVLRWAVMLFTLLITVLVVWAATGKRFTDEILLPSVIVSYGAADFSYSLLSTLLYRERKRKEKEQKAQNNGSKSPPSYGEFVGTGFVAVLFFVGILTGFDIWRFDTIPDAAFIAIDITVGIIALSSVAKIMVLPKVPRKRHNSALYFLSVYSTIVILLLMSRDAVHNSPIVDDYLWSYGFILASYVAHNVIFAIVRPGIPQKRHGELVAMSVVLFTVFTYLLNAMDIVYLPRFITPFFIITIMILGVGAGGKFLLKDLIRERMFGTIDEDLIREHLNNEHDSDIIKDCPECEGYRKIKNRTLKSR